MVAWNTYVDAGTPEAILGYKERLEVQEQRVEGAWVSDVFL